VRNSYVIHKNLLSPVYKVRKRVKIYGFVDCDADAFPVEIPWTPDSYCVENPDWEGDWFKLPKSDYVPCDKNGVVKESNVETSYLAHCGSEPQG
jgi:hypothetical protein